MASVAGSIDGQTVHEVVLTSQTGVRISILTYGALIRDWRVPVGSTMRPVVMGFDDIALYYDHSPYFGAIAGRVANRIGNARFTLNGAVYDLPANEGPNQLHGGPEGIARQIWQIAEESENRVRLTLFSPDGAMGYPGNLEIAVTYTLTGNRLEIDFAAETDKPTPVNIVQHNYFNLMGQGDVLDHRLSVPAGAFVELGAGQIPTGAILPTHGTDLDFRRPRTLRKTDGEGQEIDYTLVLDTGRDRAEPAAIAEAPDGSLTLRLYTDQPGMQVYNGWKLEVPVPGLDGAHYTAFGGLCLEDQNFPDAINNPHFPSSVVTPQAPYHHWCAIEIG
ncbi:aldose epimerase family protein [Pelagibacterium halotolerans]|uniref:Aldose 1-epimerase n=1 Tax=Pelagibacterium halotolerans (strain DSM 22347 / JCM 15775 / CGMCC 1.7692 / B2) TaxID=1082931 RepID=G4RGX9_PELHB|nr:aldose epimerase family protein [Pelagibacterium halotolerans]AEQ53132.1 aldose 1-epimerase [Pelagibacterium halotolerans B2]QJR17229.1 galactose mutarotase [Pelagibacterium halotolerans]SEA88592.1 aldose 1-epimerase [Pelagibacterium halotolerans]